MPAKTPVMMTVSGSERGSGITSRLGTRRIGLGHKRPHDCGRLQGIHSGGKSTTASGLGNYSFMALERPVFVSWDSCRSSSLFSRVGLDPWPYFDGLDEGHSGSPGVRNGEY